MKNHKHSPMLIPLLFLFIICSFMVFYNFRKNKGNATSINLVEKNFKCENIKLKSDFADIDEKGNVFIKQDKKYIAKIGKPSFADMNSSSKKTQISFTDNNWNINMKDKKFNSSVERNNNELSVKFSHPNFANITSPYYPINIKDRAIYKFILNYSMTPYKDKNLKDSKHKIYPFTMFTINYYDSNKKLIDKKSTRAYVLKDGTVFNLFDYSFIPKKETYYVTLNITQFNQFMDIKLKDAVLHKYLLEESSPIEQKNSIVKKPEFNEIVQTYKFTDRNVTRTIRHNLRDNTLDITKKVNYLKDVQNFEEYEPIWINSNTINYLGRDFKNHTKLNTKDPYVTDYTTPYFSKFENNNVLSCSPNYTSIETSKKKNNYNIKIYNNNSQDTKYLLIGQGGITQNIFTQKFLNGSTNNLNYSFLLNYKGPNVIPSRTPNGTKGTFIITHHADGNTTKVLNALMLGSSDKKSTFYNDGGFFHYKIPSTWSFFSKSLLNIEGIDSPEYNNIIKLMKDNGIEVVPHGIDPISSNNSRDTLKKYMPILAQYNIQNWVDHSLGHGARSANIKSDASIPSNKNFSLDLFKKHGYKYCWSYVDVDLEKDLDMLRSSENSFHPQIFFKNDNFSYNGYSLYQWSTYRPKNFISEVNKTNLDEIILNNGIAVMHDYFTHPMQLNKFFVKSENEIHITKSLNDTLKLLYDYRENKNLWIPTVKDFINYSLLIHNVDISYTSKGIILNNKNKTTIKGYTLILLDNKNTPKYLKIDLKPGKTCYPCG